MMANVNFLSILLAAVAAWLFGGGLLHRAERPVARGAGQDHGAVQGGDGGQVQARHVLRRSCWRSSAR